MMTGMNFVYIGKMYILIQIFQDRFADFREVKPLLYDFRSSFTISPENVPKLMQLELIDM